ncbi:MAG: dipeptide epimerase [Candidatus Obscuribacterales bacterium]|nr:dipeptide epimerase [Candidatus Obscuribacterales bacterium]
MSKVETKSKLKLSFEILKLRTKHPFGISYGSSSDSINVLVRLQYGDIEGLGECSPASYHMESPSTVMAVLDDLSKKDILGDDPFAIQEICKRMDKAIAGNYSAKAGIELALQDICGKIVDKPLYQLLGLSGMPAPITDFTIGIDSLEMLERKTKEAIDDGFKVLKVKQGTSYDRQIIETVRKFAPDIPLRVDANGAWSPKQAVEMSKFLAEHNVQFIEQPIPKYAHLDEWRFVRENCPLPIFADESCCRATDVARLANVVDGVVVKLAKTGGLSEALRLIHCARAHNLKVMIGCMIESSIGISAAAHIAPLVDYLDLDGAMLLAEDPFDGAVYKDGYMALTDRPGLGVIPRK